VLTKSQIEHSYRVIRFWSEQGERVVEGLNARLKKAVRGEGLETREEAQNHLWLPVPFHSFLPLSGPFHRGRMAGWKACPTSPCVRRASRRLRRRPA
jgi:hypothetical protein